MAKHRKHRRRARLGDLMKVGFGLSNPLSNLPTSVNTKAVAEGAGIGLLGALGIRFLWNQFAPASLTASATAVNADGSPQSPILYFINDNMPALGAIAAGGLVAAVGKKRKSPDAAAHLVGAGLVGVGILALHQAQNFLPASFRGLQVVKLGRHYRALVLRDADRPAMRGIVVPLQAQQPRMLPAANMAGKRMNGMVVPFQQARRPG